MKEGGPNFDGGYFAVYRRAFQDDPLWTEPRVWSRAEAWMYLLAITAHGPHDKPLKGGRLIHLERGEFFASLRYLARKWGWSKDRVARFLAVLCSPLERIVRQNRDADGDTYLVVNYETYQNGRDRDETGARQTRDRRETKEKKEEEGRRREEEGAPVGAPRASSRPEIPAEILLAIPTFAEMWMERMRAAGRKRPNPSAEGKQLDALVKALRQHGAECVIAAVEDAARGGYQGIFPEKFTRNGLRPGRVEDSAVTRYRRTE